MLQKLRQKFSAEQLKRYEIYRAETLNQRRSSKTDTSFNIKEANEAADFARCTYGIHSPATSAQMKENCKKSLRAMFGFWALSKPDMKHYTKNTEQYKQALDEVFSGYLANINDAYESYKKGDATYLEDAAKADYQLVTDNLTFKKIDAEVRGIDFNIAHEDYLRERVKQTAENFRELLFEGDEERAVNLRSALMVDLQKEINESREDISKLTAELNEDEVINAAYDYSDADDELSVWQRPAGVDVDEWVAFHLLFNAEMLVEAAEYADKLNEEAKPQPVANKAPTYN